MSKEMSIPEIIHELDRIHDLYYNIECHEKKIDKLASEGAQEEMDQAAERFHNNLSQFESEQMKKKPKVVGSGLLEHPPYIPERVKLSVGHNAVYGGISLALIYLTVILGVVGYFISFFSVKIGMLSFIVSLLLVVPTIIMCIKFPISNALNALESYEKIKAYEEKVKEAEDSFAKYNSPEDMEKRYKAFMEYEAVFLSCVENCDKAYAEESARLDAELEEIKQNVHKKLEEYQKEIDALQNELEGVDLIPDDLFYIAGSISSLLKQKRADSLKEAINLALDEERKDEEERARREEAEWQQYILEQQAYDNRRHNEAMARQAEADARAMREHNAAMERAAKAQADAARVQADAARAQADAAQAQAREAQRQTQMAQKQASDAWRNAHQRCIRCVKYGSCGVRGDAIIGCTGFTPR